MKYFIAVLLILGGGYFYTNSASNIQTDGFFTGWYVDYAGYEEARVVAEETESLMLVYFYKDW